MSTGMRLKVGLALLVVGLLLPFATVVVFWTDWPDWVKNGVAGLLIFGFEIVMIPAVALMGRENYDRIVAQVRRTSSQFAVAHKVSRPRYRFGLALLGTTIVVAWIVSYLPALLPADPGTRLLVNLALDFILAVSLFVLGGEFWDKLRALFLYDARVTLPGVAKP